MCRTFVCMPMWIHVYSGSKHHSHLWQESCEMHTGALPQYFRKLRNTSEISRVSFLGELISEGLSYDPIAWIPRQSLRQFHQFTSNCTIILLWSLIHNCTKDSYDLLLYSNCTILEVLWEGSNSFRTTRARCHWLARWHAARTLL